MDVEKLSPRYRFRRMTEADTPLMLALMAGNPLFYRHCPPEPSVEGIRSDLEALPPRTTPADKFYIGAFDGERLVALVDLILHYPNRETAFIGFFMVAAEYQGSGVGSRIVTDMLAYLTALGFTHVRLGYVKGNAQSRRFWHKNQFTETGVETHTEHYTIVVMQRALSASHHR